MQLNKFHIVNAASFHYPIICFWTSRLLLLSSYCPWSSNKHGQTIHPWKNTESFWRELRIDSASAYGSSLLALAFCGCCCCKHSHSFPQWLPQVTLQPTAPKQPLFPTALSVFAAICFLSHHHPDSGERVALICISLMAKTMEYFLRCYIVGLGLEFFV